MGEAPGRPQAPRGATSALVFVGATLFYLLTFATDSDGQILGGDVTHYARSLAAGDPWNPHHLLFHLAAALVAGLVDLLGGEASGGVTVREGLVALGITSALGAGCTVALVHRFAVGCAGALRGGLVTAVLAVASGFWFFSAVGESQPTAIAALAGLLTTACAMALGRRAARAAPLVAWLLLAVLMRQDTVLVVPALLVLVPLRLGLRVVAVAGALAVGLYAGAWLLASPGVGFVHWLRELATTGEWGQATTAGDYLGALGTALGKTGAALSYPWPFLGAAALLAVPFALGVPRGPRVALGLLLFALCRVAFLAWWEAGNLEHHATTWLPLVLLLAVAVAPRTGAPRDPSPVVPAALALLVAALAAGNATTMVAPNRGTTADRRAREVAAQAGPDGLVVTLDFLSFAAHQRAAPDVPIAPAFPVAAPDVPARITTTLTAGARVLLTRDPEVGARFTGISALPPSRLVADLAAGRPATVLEQRPDEPAWLIEIEVGG